MQCDALEALEGLAKTELGILAVFMCAPGIKERAQSEKVPKTFQEITKSGARLPRREPGRA